jgi:hypothetical protein
MKPRLFAKAPDGSLISRTTHKKYSHAVLVPRADVTGPMRAVGSATWVSWGWTTDPERMLKEARLHYKRAVAVPVQP